MRRTTVGRALGIVVLLTALLGCGKGKPDCKKGKPCGDTCIDKDDTCRK